MREWQKGRKAAWRCKKPLHRPPVTALIAQRKRWGREFDQRHLPGACHRVREGEGEREGKGRLWQERWQRERDPWVFQAADGLKVSLFVNVQRGARRSEK